MHKFTSNQKKAIEATMGMLENSKPWPRYENRLPLRISWGIYIVTLSLAIGFELYLVYSPQYDAPLLGI